MDDREEEVQRVLDTIDGLAEGGSPADRAKRLSQLLDAVPEKIRRARQQAVREMHTSGMTYRQIGDELGISFGRVRQILAHGEPTKPADSA